MVFQNFQNLPLELPIPMKGYWKLPMHITAPYQKKSPGLVFHVAIQKRKVKVVAIAFATTFYMSQIWLQPSSTIATRNYSQHLIIFRINALTQARDRYTRHRNFQWLLAFSATSQGISNVFCRHVYQNFWLRFRRTFVR